MTGHHYYHRPGQQGTPPPQTGSTKKLYRDTGVLLPFFYLLSDHAGPIVGTAPQSKDRAMTTEIKENKTYRKNGYVRRVLSVSDNTLHIKTIGTPVPKSPGRPPLTGIVETRSFLKWLNSKKEKSINKSQLTI